MNRQATERANLHKTIWRIANDLRGSANGWDSMPSAISGGLVTSITHHAE
jgi:type I restriction-modification system DNA methylase subunit